MLTPGKCCIGLLRDRVFVGGSAQVVHREVGCSGQSGSFVTDWKS